MVPNGRNRKSVRCAQEFAPQADTQPADWLAEPQYAGLPDSPDALVDELLASGRYALLLRPEMSQHLERGHIVPHRATTR